VSRIGFQVYDAPIMAAMGITIRGTLLPYGNRTHPRIIVVHPISQRGKPQ
jgi:hypothetical protein